MNLLPHGATIAWACTSVLGIVALALPALRSPHRGHVDVVTSLLPHGATAAWIRALLHGAAAMCCGSSTGCCTRLLHG
ncbi:hypothetical protein GOP47_0007660 [Adiantum capillus-veneris]|uniref:Uncharacterized protein n=1 Tax=Adiantum capillus-veneris TaxID=13818 RepID=A0A9D4V150_ADICA|nr:hypothetical protein GOP47_0007660 [Adiantum capillus-veneris]